MHEARRVQLQASGRGFDWPDADGVVTKVFEEVQEIEEVLLASQPPSRERLHQEVGDLLFSAVNLARFLGVDPTGALSDATKRFVDRFQRMDKAIRHAGHTIEGSSIEELDAVWEDVKGTYNGCGEGP